MITGSITLTSLKNVITSVKKPNGEEIKGIFIPLEANKLEVHTNGSVYLSIVAWENKTPSDKSTHGIKQNFSKEVREAMTKEESYALPFLGNLSVKGSGESTPTVNTDANLEAGILPTMGTDDLPFN